MPDSTEVVVQLATPDDPDILRKKVDELISTHNVVATVETQIVKQAAFEPTTGGIILTSLAFGAALLPFLTELLKLVNPDASKNERGIKILKSKITVNNITVNLDQKSIETILPDDKLKLPPELLKTLIASFETSRDIDQENDLIDS